MENKHVFQLNMAEYKKKTTEQKKFVSNQNEYEKKTRNDLIEMVECTQIHYCVVTKGPQSIYLLKIKHTK